MEFLSSLPIKAKALFPGFLAAGLVAIAAQFLSDHYGAPAMLMALLLGIAMNFLSATPQCKSGIAFSARTILRMGVALLGMRISVDLAQALGIEVVILVAIALGATIGFGFLIAPLLKHKKDFAFLTAGAVAICGASAAMAISAILPHNDKKEEQLVFTVIGVTIFSTIAMILYPILLAMIGVEERLAGIFIGATIHDVAQVVGAGFSINESVGETSVFVKLLRVAMLAPVIFIATLVIRIKQTSPTEAGKKPPLLPSFVIAFIIFAALNSFNLIPVMVADTAIQISRWALLCAIVAVGMKTNLKDLVKMGMPAVSLLAAETLFIAAIIAVGLYFMPAL